MIYRKQNSQIQRFLIITMILLLTACTAKNENNPDGVFHTQKLSFRIDTLATGLTNPWGMAFLPDGRILIAERPGRLRIWENGSLAPDPVGGLPDVWAHGQGGLLEVALHPDYEQNGWLYLGFSMRSGNGGNTAIARAQLEGDELKNVEVVFHGHNLTNAAHHFGCRIVFDEQNYLFFAIGDRGEMHNAQLLTNHNGKVMRIHDDGVVPVDNPFVDVEGAMPEIWTYGNRNIQGMALHPQTGALWSHEHGPKGGDEINLMVKGGNYGWPLATHGINYDGSTITPDTTLPGMIDPVLHWTPSIAPCGLAFVSSERYPSWNGNMLVGALAGQHIHRVEFDGDKVIHTEKLLQGFARFRDVRQGPDGYLYVLTEFPGIFFRIVPL
jgi:aldose sugar dehydrogenase